MTDTAATNGVQRRPISWAKRQWIKERDTYRCRQCGTHENLTVDHIVPVAEGGTNDPENLQTLCQSCNSRKGKKRIPAGAAPSDAPGPLLAYRVDLVVGCFERGSLVGSFFLSDSGRGWQGCVVAEPAPGTYLVELFSWLWGQPTEQLLVRIEDMQEWTFYDTDEWMRAASDKRSQQREVSGRSDEGQP